MILAAESTRRRRCRRWPALLLAGVAACGDGASTDAPDAPDAKAPAAADATPSIEAGPSFSGEGFTGGGRWFVRWRTAEEGIPHLEPFRLLVEVLESPEGPPADASVGVFADAAMPHHGHGMNLVPRTRRTGDGRFEIEGMLFHMDGRWELFVDVEHEGLLERAQWTVTLD
jgi:hypothetical protein